jgi:hypothetical protein
MSEIGVTKVPRLLAKSMNEIHQSDFAEPRPRLD